MSSISIVQVSLEIWGSMFCLICAVLLTISNVPHRRSTTILCNIMYMSIMLLLFDSLAYIFRGDDSYVGMIMTRLSNFIVFASQIILTVIFGFYFEEILKEYDIKPSRLSFRIIRILCVINLLLLVVSQFNGFYYYFDVGNYYHRNDYIIICFSLSLACLLIYANLVFRYRKYINDITILSLISFSFFPVIMAIIQMFAYGLSLVNLGIAVSFILVFTAHMIDRANLVRVQSQALQNTQNRLLISQIQPHFIYNCLALIRSLINPDNEDALTAVDEFSAYLRGVTNSINYSSTVDLDYEKDIISHYIYMEKKRFDERLNVIYDYEDTDNYRIPPMTLQPLVENSIKHGLMEKLEGGTLTIHTYKDNAFHYVDISDDGVGFDTAMLATLGKQHVGVNNIKQRLKYLCGGELVIESAPGSGTRSTVKIPIK